MSTLEQFNCWFKEVRGTPPGSLLYPLFVIRQYHWEKYKSWAWHCHQVTDSCSRLPPVIIDTFSIRYSMCSRSKFQLILIYLKTVPTVFQQCLICVMLEVVHECSDQFLYIRGWHFGSDDQAWIQIDWIFLFEPVSIFMWITIKIDIIKLLHCIRIWSCLPKKEHFKKAAFQQALW